MKAGMIIYSHDREAVPQTLAELAFRYNGMGMAVADQDAYIISVNEAFVCITGVSQEEAKGRDLCFFAFLADRDDFYDSMITALKSEKQWEGEVWSEHPGKGLICRRVTVRSAAPAEDGGVYLIATFEDATEREKLCSDIRKAGVMQKDAMPAPISDSRFDMDVIYEAKRYVSGDCYDFVRSRDGRKLTGIVADFMGHGLSAAFQTSVVRLLFRQNAGMDAPLQKRAERLNREATECLSDETFAAAIFYEFDFDTGLLSVVSAGINYFYGRIGGNPVYEKLKGTFLGLREDASFEVCMYPFRSGDSFYFLSDGFLDVNPNPFDGSDMGYNATTQALRRLTQNRKLQDDCTATCIIVK